MSEVIEGLKKFTKNSNKIIKLINGYEKIGENAVNNAYVLEKKLNEISRILPELSEGDLKKNLVDWLNKEKEKVESYKEDFRFRFGKELNGLFAEDGRKVRGQYPILRIGFYTLKLDFQFGQATLFFGPEIEKIKSKIPLQPGIIYDTVKKYDKDLFTLKSSPEDIFKDLYEAYKRRLKLGNKSFGDKLLITEVLNEYVMLKQSKKFFTDPQRSNFREYPRVRLSYLLYSLKKASLMEKGMKLHVATFNATVDRMNSIWVPENEEGEGTHYGYISFHNG